MLIAMYFSFSILERSKEWDLIIMDPSALTLILGELGTRQERGMEKT